MKNFLANSYENHPYLISILFGLLIYPVQTLVYLIFGLGLYFYGINILTFFAPMGGLGGLFLGVLLLQLLLFVLALGILAFLAWRVFGSLKFTAVACGTALTLSVVSTVALIYSAQADWRATEARLEENAQKLSETISLLDVRGEVSNPLSVEVDPSYVPEYERAYATGTLIFDVDVKTSAGYKFYITLLEGGETSFPHEFTFDIDKDLDKGRQLVDIPVPVQVLKEQAGLLWSWLDVGTTQVKVELWMVGTRSQLGEFYGADPNESVKELRAMGVPEEEIAALIPPADEKLKRFITRQRFTIDKVPVSRTRARHVGKTFTDPR